MIIIDAHLDLAWNALNWNRDLTLPVAEIRRTEMDMHEEHRGANTVSLPEMRRGEVAVCLATVLARASALNEPLLDYRNQDIACAMAQGQLAYYRLLESRGLTRMLTTWAELERHTQAWKQGQQSVLPLGLILSMEGADPIVFPEQVTRWWDDGLRVVGLAHYGVNAYAHGTGAAGGLTPKGRELLRLMEDLGIVLDVTHLAEGSFWEAVEMFRGPLLASHHNCRALVPGERQLSDHQIRCLIERDAVIGVALDIWMLFPDWVLGKTPNTVAGLQTVANHIDHICQLAGNARHVAVGSDLDGGFGKEQSPYDLETIADLQRIPDILRPRGYGEADIEAVMHNNWLRFFHRAWSHGS